MLTDYKGQVRNGRPEISENIDLPEHASIIVTVLDDNEANREEYRKNAVKRQQEAVKRFAAALDAIDDEPYEECHDFILNNRLKYYIITKTPKKVITIHNNSKERL